MGFGIRHKKFLPVFDDRMCFISLSFMRNERIKSHGGDCSKFFRTHKKEKKS
jgi:hypothetical protein